MIDENTSLRDVAGAISGALRPLGYDPVVVGGSAAAIHAPEAYRSRDLDLVLLPDGPEGEAERRQLIDAFEKLGYTLENAMFVHATNPFTVDFVKGPVAIGDHDVDQFAVIETKFGPLRILDVTDAVRDRLNKFLVWDDTDALDAAVAVARQCVNEVDLDRIRAFVEREGVGAHRERSMRGFEIFRRRLTPEKPERSSFGFTTAVRVRFAEEPTRDLAQHLARRVQELLDRDRDQILGLEGVDVRPSPNVIVSGVDVTIPLPLRTKTDLSFVEKLRVAIDVIDHLRSRQTEISSLEEVLEDDSPTIATVGSFGDAVV